MVGVRWTSTGPIFRIYLVPFFLPILDMLHALLLLSWVLTRADPRSSALTIPLHKTQGVRAVAVTSRRQAVDKQFKGSLKLLFAHSFWCYSLWLAGHCLLLWRNKERMRDESCSLPQRAGQPGNGAGKMLHEAGIWLTTSSTQTPLSTVPSLSNTPLRFWIHLLGNPSRRTEGSWANHFHETPALRKAGDGAIEGTPYLQTNVPPLIWDFWASYISNAGCFQSTQNGI